ncbi:MAG: MazG-like family protein [Clostridiales bacterium]|nr:MazG-like family protein [Clostridiales bacterium]
MNISNNLKAIEEIKSDILSEVANLYRTLADYDELADYGPVESSISTIVAMDYILARHLGITFGTLDARVCELLSIAEENGHSLENEYNDMSELKKYIRQRA